MNCSDFVARSSDYFDGSASAEDMGVLERHLRACASCRRYKVVYEQGTSLLRSLPEPEVGEDFEPRLRHRLFHLDDRRALLDSSGSATPAFTILGLAVFLSAVAWSPVLRSDGPVVDLPPIVVDDVRPEPRRGLNASLGGRFVTAAGFASTTELGAIERGLWDDARLYEYSRLSKRYLRDDPFRRAGLDHQ